MIFGKDGETAYVGFIGDTAGRTPVLRQAPSIEREFPLFRKPPSEHTSRAFFYCSLATDGYRFTQMLARIRGVLLLRRIAVMHTACAPAFSRASCACLCFGKQVYHANPTLSPVTAICVHLYPSVAKRSFTGVSSKRILLETENQKLYTTGLSERVLLWLGYAGQCHDADFVRHGPGGPACILIQAHLFQSQGVIPTG